MKKAILNTALVAAAATVCYFGAAAFAHAAPRERLIAQANATPIPDPTNIKINGHDEEYDVGTRHVTVVARDVFAMTGLDLDRWPYMEASNSPKPGYIPGMNLMVPDGSHWGWRFISRVTERDVTTRASIDVNGNADFNGSVHGQKLEAGAPGSYTPEALTWGNHLGSDFQSTLSSSDTIALYGVKAEVFGISYSKIPVLTQDAHGNLAVYGDAIAKRFSAATIQAGGSSITAGENSPSANCSPGDLYMRKDGAPGAALYSCTSTNVWTAVGSKPQTPSLSPVFSSSSFASRSLAGPPSPTILATVPITLGQSSGSKGDWYVCSVIEATVEGTVAGSKPVGVTFGIGATQAGAGTAFRMYSRPQRNEKNPSFDDTVVSDWSVGLGEATGDGTQNATSDGRYCNTYANRATLSFTGYAVPSLGTTPNTVFTSGRIEIEATPQ